MSKETELSSQWLEAWRLRQWAKGKTAEALGKKIEEIETQMYEEADERLDSYFQELKRGDNFPKRKGNLGFQTHEGNKTERNNY